MNIKHTNNKLSVVIITHNEEDNIRDCLESVKWADEIIVVDFESDDKTPKICDNYNIFFYNEPWKGFSCQKNSAIKKATKNEEDNEISRYMPINRGTCPASGMSPFMSCFPFHDYMLLIQVI